ncbi:hypothetical protein TIFTF001_056869, partial [Ficus carica]
MKNRGSHFVLVHGACHGAWCWYKVAAQLKSTGHKVTALDLAASGIHPKQVHEVHSLSDYVEPLLDYMASLPPEKRVTVWAESAYLLPWRGFLRRFLLQSSPQHSCL